MSTNSFFLICFINPPHFHNDLKCSHVLWGLSRAILHIQISFLSFDFLSIDGSRSFFHLSIVSSGATHLLHSLRRHAFFSPHNLYYLHVWNTSVTHGIFFKIYFHTFITDLLPFRNLGRLECLKSRGPVGGKMSGDGGVYSGHKCSATCVSPRASSWPSRSPRSPRPNTPSRTEVRWWPICATQASGWVICAPLAPAPLICPYMCDLWAPHLCRHPSHTCIRHKTSPSGGVSVRRWSSTCLKLPTIFAFLGAWLLLQKKNVKPNSFPF